MTGPILNGFLLATAQEYWYEWYSNLRWQFADWCDENGRDDAAQLLRTMQVEIADEWDLQGRILLSLEYSGLTSQKLNNAPIVCRLELTALGKPYRIEDTILKPGWSGYQKDMGGVPGHHVRLSAVCQSEFAMEYALNSREGVWRGMLSFDRACRQCRRRVLGMFVDIEGGIDPTLILPQDELSPRWFPYATRSIRNYRGQRDLRFPIPD